MTANNALKATPVQGQPPRKNVFADLRSPGLFAKYPIIGILMFIFGTLVFGGLTYNLLTNGPLIKWDILLANTLPAIGLKSPQYIKVIMISGFYLGKEVIMGFSVLLSFYFIYKKYWQELTMVVIGWSGASLIFYTLSHIIGRVRPSTQIWIVLNIPGFPSGHGVSLVVCYGLLAYLLVPRMPSAFWKGVVIAFTLLIIGFVGYSRIFTGGHYLTDILAGYAVGIAWFGLVYTLIEIYFQKRRSKNAKKE